MLILGAISLHHAISSLPDNSKRRYRNIVYTLPGLSLNPWSRNHKKNIQYQLKHNFSDEKNVILWHDVVNNSTTPHPSNNNQPLSLESVKHILDEYSTSILAVIHCPRQRAPDASPALVASNVVTVYVLTDLISKRKQKNVLLKNEYSKLHQAHELELKSLTLVLIYANNLDILSSKTRKKLNKRHRKALKSRPSLLAASS